MYVFFQIPVKCVGYMVRSVSLIFVNIISPPVNKVIGEYVKNSSVLVTEYNSISFKAIEHNVTVINRNFFIKEENSENGCTGWV